MSEKALIVVDNNKIIKSVNLKVIGWNTLIDHLREISNLVKDLLNPDLTSYQAAFSSI